MKINTNPVRGTYDYPPIQAESREVVKQKILASYQDNGFTLIDTPILENLSLLDSSEGGDNLRLMFKTIKRGAQLDLTKPNLCEKDITEEGLRYDLTVPLARFYAGNRENLPNPFKSIQIGYSFRAERPQKGRNRQFVQCDIDIFGDASVNAEIEVITTVMDTYARLGFNDVTMKVNSRKLLNALVLNSGFGESDINSVCISLDKLDKIGIDGVCQELIDKGYDVDNVDKLIKCSAEIQNMWTEGCEYPGIPNEIIAELRYIIDTCNQIITNGRCAFDISIVRGQGYYTGAVYEAYVDGFGGAIGGGGRYDNMVNKLIGMDVPAVGFGMGFEPVCLVLSEQGKTQKSKQKIALIYEKEDNFGVVLARKRELMKQYAVSTYVRPKNMKAMLDKLKFANFDGFMTMQDNSVKVL